MEITRGDGRLGFEICHLSTRMNAGIGPPCTDNPNQFLRHILQDRLNLFLYCPSFRLPLPSNKICSVIFDDYFYVAHTCLAVKKKAPL
jgi:hypothetical protein